MPRQRFRPAFTATTDPLARLTTTQRRQQFRAEREARQQQEAAAAAARQEQQHDSPTSSAFSSSPPSALALLPNVAAAAPVALALDVDDAPTHSDAVASRTSSANSRGSASGSASRRSSSVSARIGLLVNSLAPQLGVDTQAVAPAAAVAGGGAAAAAVAPPATPRGRRRAPAVVNDAAPAHAAHDYRSALDGESDALLTLFRRQSMLGIDTWLHITELVSFHSAGTTPPRSAPIRRTILLRLNGAAISKTQHNNTVAKQAYHALLREKKEIFGATRNAQVRKWPTCTYVEEYPGGGYSELQQYGRFPLLPGDLSSDATFETRYESLQILSDAETAALPPEVTFAQSLADAAAHAVAASATHRSWTTVPVSDDNRDDLVDAHLNAWGTAAHVSTLRRVDDGPERNCWRQLAHNTLRGYRGATLAARESRLRALLAAPAMFLKTPPAAMGAANKREVMRAQLSGSVVDLGPRSGATTFMFADMVLSPLSVSRVEAGGGAASGDAVAAAAPDAMSMLMDVSPPGRDGRRKELSPAEFREQQLRRAFTLVRQNQIGRARQALMRDQVEPQDPEVLLSNLQKLHPHGDAPDITPPETPLFSADSFSGADLLKIAQANLSGSAPGPDQLTFELLHDALENPGFAFEFAGIVADILNGAFSCDTRRLLSAATLIGIPKASGGTRPLALGSVVLKIANTAALHTSTRLLAAHFAHVQFGVATKNGCEFVIHSTRAFLRRGVLPSAPGAPSRTFGRDRVVIGDGEGDRALPEARRRLLHGLFVVGSPNHDIIESARGSRQGDVLASVAFALAIHPALLEVNKLPGVVALAYLDDITLLAENCVAAERALALLHDRLGTIGLVIKLAKCELMTTDRCPVDWSSMPKLSALREAGGHVNVLKLLGASLGLTNPLEADHLFARENERGQAMCERLTSDPTPQFFLLLRMCLIAKLSYVTRVHDPEVSQRLCRTFDARVEALMAHWASCRMTPRARLILELPRSMGGLGLLRHESIAPAAYAASLAVIRGAKQIRQRELAMQLLKQRAADATENDPLLQRHLSVHALNGSDAGLSHFASSCHPDVFSALLRSRLMTDSRLVDPGLAALTCPGAGCRTSFPLGGPWGEHASSCVSVYGGGVTRRHNTIAFVLRTLLRESGCVVDNSEPRDMAHYRCGCGVNLPHEEYKLHRPTCADATRAPLHTSGPDVRFSFQGRTIVGDLTFVNLMVATNRARAPDDVLADADKAKHARYDALCAAAGADFVAYVASANGYIAPAFLRRIDQCSADAFKDKHVLRNAISAEISHLTACARLRAEDAQGIKPPTHDATQRRLLERYRYQPGAVKDGEPGLDVSPDRPNRASPRPPCFSENNLRDIIENCVSAAIRAQFQALGVAAVDAILEEQAASERRRSASRAASEPLGLDTAPLPAPHMTAEQQRCEAFRLDVLRSEHIDKSEREAEALAARTANLVAASADIEARAAADARDAIAADNARAAACLERRDREANLRQRATSTRMMFEANARTYMAEAETARARSISVANTYRGQREEAAAHADAAQRDMQHQATYARQAEQALATSRDSYDVRMHRANRDALQAFEAAKVEASAARHATARSHQQANAEHYVHSVHGAHMDELAARLQADEQERAYYESQRAPLPQLQVFESAAYAYSPAPNRAPSNAPAQQHQQSASRSRSRARATSRAPGDNLPLMPRDGVRGASPSVAPQREREPDLLIYTRTSSSPFRRSPARDPTPRGTPIAPSSGYHSDVSDHGETPAYLGAPQQRSSRSYRASTTPAHAPEPDSTSTSQALFQQQRSGSSRSNSVPAATGASPHPRHSSSSSPSPYVVPSASSDSIVTSSSSGPQPTDDISIINAENAEVPDAMDLILAAEDKRRYAQMRAASRSRLLPPQHPNSSSRSSSRNSSTHSQSRRDNNNNNTNNNNNNNTASASSSSPFTFGNNSGGAGGGAHDTTSMIRKR